MEQATPAAAPTATPYSADAVRDDRLTVAAVAVCVYAVASVLHEAVGHGGACLAVGGVARAFSSQMFDCDARLLGASAERVVAAGGTAVTLAAGALSLALFRRTSTHDAPVWRYALWLSAAVNLMQGTGYFLYSGVANIGDWSEVIRGLEPAWAWRVAMAVAGGLAYRAVTRLVFRDLAALTADARPERYRRALTLATFAYVVGGALALAAGLRDAAGAGLVVISGAAASLGGTSGLAFGPQYLRGTPQPATAGSPAPVRVSRSAVALVLGVVVAVAFVLVLGRGVRFG